MFCSKCGKTLMPEDKQCPHCGNPVGESRFEGTPYTSAQAHVLPNTPAGTASAAYTRTTYTTMTEAQQQEGAVDSRTTYRPVYDDASAPEDIRKDLQAAIKGDDEADKAPEQPPIEDLPEDVQNTLNAVDEELRMESMDTSELQARPIESTGRAGISTEVEDYIQKLEATQNRRAARRRKAVDEGEEAYATPQEDNTVYDDTKPEADDGQSEVFNDIDEEEFDEIRYGRTIGVKEILRVALFMLLAAALIVGGVLGFRYFRQRAANTSKIEGVTQSLYESGIELIQSRRDGTYINDLVNVYRNEGIMAYTQRVTADAGAIDALLPEEPAVNDPLFISALQTIQSNIGNAILMDATEADQTAGNSGQDSAARWAIVDETILEVQNATTAQELTAILNGEHVTVASSPTPSPVPEVTYNTLSKGDKSDEVMDMQNRLYMLGFLLDDRDGAFGNKTQTAVKLFQQAAGLEATGIADNETLTRMYADDAPTTEYAQATPTPAPEITPEPEPEAAPAAEDAPATGEAYNEGAV